MKKMESILMFILLLFVFGIAGCGGITPPITPSPTETVLLESPYIIVGENVGGVMDFHSEMKIFYGQIGLLGGFEKVGEYIGSIKQCDSILVISPTSEGVEEFRNLEKEYAVLCPLSADDLDSKLDSNSSPLFYFSQDTETGRNRGIIVIKKLYSELAGLLKDGIPLDVSFRYEDGELEILE